MDRRFLLFLLLSAVILMGSSLIQSLLFPPPPRQPVAKKEGAVAEKDGKEARPAKADQKPKAVKEQPAQADADEAAKSERRTEAQPPEEAQPAAVAEAKQKPQRQPEPPIEHVRLGSDEPESGYPFLVTLTNKGAALERVTLNDPRYRRLKDRNRQLDVVGFVLPDQPAPDQPSLLLELTNGGSELSERNWEVTSREQDDRGITNGVVFRTVWAQRDVAVEKHYRIHPSPSADKYAVDLTIRLVNLAENPQEVTYKLEGPNGLPLEGLWYTRTYRNVAVGFLEESDSVRASTLDVNTLVDQVKNDEVEEWTNLKRPHVPFDERQENDQRDVVKYIGVVSQYFGALLLPGGDQREQPWIARAQPIVVGKPREEQTNVSVQLTSHPLELAPGEDGAVEHTYTLFAGPQQPELLAAYELDDLQRGWLSAIISVLLVLLKFFHGIIPNYGVAIILLTVVVRLGMFPLSRKSVMAMTKMQALKPELDKIKEKYKNDREKLGRAQMELYRKQGVNPLGGCLPMLVQLPIFIALYNTLYQSVDLRLAPFLWISNLAAPDQLLRWGNNVPLLSWALGPYLNILPIFTVILFIVQQKMFTPPATDEQSRMQQNMMSYMMIGMGFLFYRMPSGLCLYFIASSLWGVAERKLLPRVQHTDSSPPAAAEKGKKKKKGKPVGGPRR